MARYHRVTTRDRMETMGTRIGDRAMTPAEKQRAYRNRVRERQAAEVAAARQRRAVEAAAMAEAKAAEAAAMAEARAAVPRKTRTEEVAPEALTLAATKIVEGIRADPQDGATWLRRVLGRGAFQRLRQEMARLQEQPPP
jgi:hypothetical protein